MLYFDLSIFKLNMQHFQPQRFRLWSCNRYCSWAISIGRPISLVECNSCSIIYATSTYCNFQLEFLLFIAIGNWRQSRIYHHEHLSKREIVIQSSIFKLRNMGTAVEHNVSKGRNLLIALLGLKVHRTYLISTHPLSTHFIDKPGSLISLDMMSVRHVLIISS